MAHLWSNSKKHLIQVMDMLRYEDKQVKVEAILQFSLFLLRGNRSDEVINLIARNKDLLVEHLSSFEMAPSCSSANVVCEGIFITFIFSRPTSMALSQKARHRSAQGRLASVHQAGPFSKPSTKNPESETMQIMPPLCINTIKEAKSSAGLMSW